MVIIFVEHITNRVGYTFDFIFGQREIQYRLTSDVDIFNADSRARLNYSNRKFDVPTIPPSTLLFPISTHFKTIRITILVSRLTSIPLDRCGK